MGGAVAVLAVLGLSPPFPRVLRSLAAAAVAARPVAVEAFARGKEVVVVAVALIAAIHLQQPPNQAQPVVLGNENTGGGICTATE